MYEKTCLPITTHIPLNIAHCQNNNICFLSYLEDTLPVSPAVKPWGMFQWKHILGCYISLLITPIKAFHSLAGSPQYSPPTQRLLWTYPLCNFFARRFLLSPEQTKNRQQQSQFVPARIIPEVLGPHILQIKLTLMLFFFSCSQPCG